MHLLSCPFDADQVAPSRQLVAELAQQAGLAGSREKDFVLAVNEVLTNTIRHGGGTGHLDVWLNDGLLWFQVTDSGPGFSLTAPGTRPPASARTGGRGLWIVRQVTDRLTVTSSSAGTVIVGAIALAN